MLKEVWQATNIATKLDHLGELLLWSFVLERGLNHKFTIKFRRKNIWHESCEQTLNNPEIFSSVSCWLLCCFLMNICEKNVMSAQLWVSRTSNCSKAWDAPATESEVCVWNLADLFCDCLGVPKTCAKNHVNSVDGGTSSRKRPEF